MQKRPTHAKEAYTCRRHLDTPLRQGDCDLQCVAVRCSVLQCVAVCSSALQCVAVCCSVFAAFCSVLQRVAACCSVLQRVVGDSAHPFDKGIWLST